MCAYQQFKEEEKKYIEQWNTPVLTPFSLNIHDVYIVINHGEELKAKSPPLIWLCYVSAIGIVADGISCYPPHNSFASCKYAHPLK